MPDWKMSFQVELATTTIIRDNIIKFQTFRQLKKTNVLVLSECFEVLKYEAAEINTEKMAL
jgi:hypothetical protein